MKILNSDLDILVRIVSEGGGIENITHGFDTKKVLRGKIQAFRKGLSHGK